MTLSDAILPSAEPVWCLDRLHDTGDLFWRRDSSKVKFRCEVEVLEFERDPFEYSSHRWPKHQQRRYYNDDDNSNPVVAAITCICAIMITVLLPWFMLGESRAIEVW